jgi:hypothetical protein
MGLVPDSDEEKTIKTILFTRYCNAMIVRVFSDILR